MEYLKELMNLQRAVSKNKNIRDLCRGINEFQKGYQLRCSLVNDENGDLFVDSYSVLNKQKYFSQLLNVCRVRDIRQIEINTYSSARSST
jgi:hypothetical protein